MSSKLLATGCAFLFSVLLGGCFSREAERRAEEARAEAELQVREAQAQVARKVQEARAEVERQCNEWQPVLAKIVEEVKSELDKVYKTKTEYDLIIHTPEEGEDRLQEHAARLAKMDRIQIHDFTIGCEECNDRSLGGVAYERHYRATWVMEGRVIGVSYYSRKELDAAAFAELVQKLAPGVSEHVSRHVTLRRGRDTP